MESHQATSTGIKMKRNKVQLELSSAKIYNFHPLLKKTLVELIHQAGLCLTIFCLTLIFELTVVELNPTLSLSLTNAVFFNLGSDKMFWGSANFCLIPKGSTKRIFF